MIYRKLNFAQPSVLARELSNYKFQEHESLNFCLKTKAYGCTLVMRSVNANFMYSRYLIVKINTILY